MLTFLCTEGWRRMKGHFCTSGSSGRFFFYVQGVNEILPPFHNTFSNEYFRFTTFFQTNISVSRHFFKRIFPFYRHFFKRIFPFRDTFSSEYFQFSGTFSNESRSQPLIQPAC